MPIKMFNKQDWLVQVQRAGVRRSKRGTGGEAEAERAEALLKAELAQELKLDEAAKLLGIDREGRSAAAVPSLREFFEARWIEHAKVVQNPTTRRGQRNAFNYLLYYLGDKKLTELLRADQINSFIETMKASGPIMFAMRKDGTPWRRRSSEFTNETVNKCLQCLRAVLNLAHAECVIQAQPKIDLLPTDDSVPVIPPTEEQLQDLLAVCETYRPIAPLLPEVVQFTGETGLRRGEVFHLTWGSVDLVRDAIRVEMQTKSRVVNGRVWRPKHNKWREVPLSTKAKAILQGLYEKGVADDAAVFPNQGGAPYERMDGAPEGAGIGWFPMAVEAAGLKGRVTFHGLRHLFAVRLLTRGVAITVVSELLGHSDINLTVKRYGRFSSDAKVKWDAVKVLDAEPPMPSKPRLVAVKTN